MPAIVDTTATGDARIDGILHEDHWAVTALTFSFPSALSNFADAYDEVRGFQVLNAAQKSAARAALAEVSAFTPLVFTEVTETDTAHGAIRFAQATGRTYTSGGNVIDREITTATAFNPSATERGGDIFFHPDKYDAPALNNFSWLTFFHETGHALGLEHAHENTDFGQVPAAWDAIEFTILSYRDYPGAAVGNSRAEANSYPQGFMMLDIAALQHIYGANYATRAGNDTYSFDPGAPLILETIWDGGGADTYSFAGYATNLQIDLEPGSWSNTNAGQNAHLNARSSGTDPAYAKGNVYNALLHDDDPRSLIERAIGGSGDDIIAGNRADNRLEGRAGVDALIGRDGNDVLIGGVNPATGGDLMFGGAGNDTYYVDSALDFVDEGIFTTEYGFGGFDTIVSTADFFWDVHSAGDLLRIAETVVDPEGDGATLVGGVFDNTLVGHSGTDILFGRGGSDTYRGGDGVDFISLSTLGVTDAGAYVANGVNTVVVEARSTGTFSYDIVFEFEPGRDKLDVSDFGYGSVAEVRARGHDDGAGNCYFALGDGLDYLYIVGAVLSEIRDADFTLGG